MGHKIDQTVNAKGSAMFALQPAWHGLGTVLKHLPNAAEAIIAAGLNWEVALRELETEDGTVLEDFMATARMDTKAVLGVVSPGYPIIQNTRAFECFDIVARDEGILFESAGSLDGGKEIWALAKMPTGTKINGKDLVEHYLLMTTGHTGKKALRILPTSVRVVCWNTLRLALAGRSDAWITIRHAGDVEAAIEEAREAVDQANGIFKATSAVMKKMASKKVTQKFRDEMFGDVLDWYYGEDSRPQTNGRTEKEVLEIVLAGAQAEQKVKVGVREARRSAGFEALMLKWENDRQKLAGEGTAWALWNAISEWTDHDQLEAKPKRGGELVQAEAAFKNTLYGTAADAKEYVFEKCAEFAGAASLMPGAND